MFLKRIIFILFILFMNFFIFPSQKITIKIIDYSHKDLGKNQKTKFKSQGIATVSMGQVVYLGIDSRDLNIEKYQWSLETPENTNTKLIGPTEVNPFFKPGQVGLYKVKLTVTTTKGNFLDSILWITAGNFVGNGALVDTGNEAQCIHCHKEKVDTWKTTPHAAAFQRGIKGKLSKGFYHIYCFYCHRNGYDKDSIWDAMERKEHWHFQEELKKNGLAGLTRDLPQVANLVGVQCESCHGPGSEHLGKIDKNQISNSLSPGVCNICHDSASRSSISNQWSHSPHARFMDSSVDWKRMSQPGCANCHTAQGFWQRLAVIENKNVSDTDRNAPYKDSAGLTCAACHDPHDSTGRDFMLRAGKVEDACTACHDLLVQNNAENFSSCPQGAAQKGIGGRLFENEVLPSGGHSQIRKRCVKCHMARSPSKFGEQVGGHTFRVISKNVQKPVLNTNGCLGCHKSMDIGLVRKSQEKIKASMRQLAALLPQREKKTPTPWEKPKLPGNPSLTRVQAIASYNYYTILKDGTFGIHNPVYIKNLLEISIKNLKTGQDENEVR